MLLITFFKQFPPNLLRIFFFTLFLSSKSFYCSENITLAKILYIPAEEDTRLNLLARIRITDKRCIKYVPNFITFISISLSRCTQRMHARAQSNLGITYKSYLKHGASHGQ